jgi:hypothetical protein
MDKAHNKGRRGKRDEDTKEIIFIHRPSSACTRNVKVQEHNKLRFFHGLSQSAQENSTTIPLNLSRLLISHPS